MMSMQALCVRILISLISSEVLPIFFNCPWRIMAHSTAVCAWNLSSDNKIDDISLGGEGNLEQDVLHNVTSIGSLKFELVPLE